MSQLNIKLGLSGHFKLEAVGKDGSKRFLAEFTNLITDNGLDLLASETQANAALIACVGSGNTAPSVADTALDSLIASVSSLATGGSTGQGIDTVERYTVMTKTYLFGLGAAAGNISEVGVGRGENNLFSRSLVKDEQGNPTTITVLANEYLTVTYTLKIKQPVSDTSFSVSGYSCVLRPASVNNTIYWGGGGMALATGSSDRSAATTGSLTAITSNPSFTSANRAISATNDAYTNGTFTRTGSLLWSTGQSNFSITVFVLNFGCCAFQMSVDPPINKQNTDELTIGVTIQWGREGEL